MYLTASTVSSANFVLQGSQSLHFERGEYEVAAGSRGNGAGTVFYYADGAC